MSRGAPHPIRVLLAVAATVLVVLVLVTAPPAAAQRYTDDVYFDFCPHNIAAEAQCPSERPVCCLHMAAVRCCTTASGGCDRCTPNTPIEGYQMLGGSAVIGVVVVTGLLLFGSIITGSVGRHCAWQLEHHRVLSEYQARQALRQREAAAFKRELQETERADVPDAEACVICCARFLDCALVPCGHVCCCRFCAKRLKECPVCRATVGECYRLPDYLVRRLTGAHGKDTEEAVEGESMAMTTTAGDAVKRAAGEEDDDDDNNGGDNDSGNGDGLDEVTTVHVARPAGAGPLTREEREVHASGGRGRGRSGGPDEIEVIRCGGNDGDGDGDDIGTEMALVVTPHGSGSGQQSARAHEGPETTPLSLRPMAPSRSIRGKGGYAPLSTGSSDDE